MVAAIAIHALLVATIVAVVHSGLIQPSALVMEDAEIGYEILDEAPAVGAPKPVQRVEPVAKVEPVKPEKVDETARELQDEKSDVVGTSQAAVQRPMAAGGEGAGIASTSPFYKIKPKYPRAALVAGAEGWILLKVDVNETGAVENVRVVGGEKRNLFQDEARRAVAQWKYRPFLGADGQPIRVADHQVRVDFNLSQQ